MKSKVPDDNPRYRVVLILFKWAELASELVGKAGSGGQVVTTSMVEIVEHEV